MRLLGLLLVCGLVFGGCAAKVYNVDLNNDNGKAVMGIDYRDFDFAVKEMVQSLLTSGTLNKDDGTKYVVSTGDIVNDTTQKIDTRQLMSSIEEALMNSRLVVFTSAVGDSTDKMIAQNRDLRSNDEFDQTTIAGKGELKASKLNFSGKIFQREVYYDKKTKQVEYYFQLIVTDLKTGLRFWQKEVKVVKRGGKNIPMW